MERRKENRILALIHCARGILIFSIPIAVHFQFLSDLSRFPPGVDIAIVGPSGLMISLIALSLVECYNAYQILEEKFEDLLVPLLTMILVVIVELIFTGSLSVVDPSVLATHISFVIGLSVVEGGLIALYYVR